MNLKKKFPGGGLDLKSDKQLTDTTPIETLPAPSIVTIPLLQHTNGLPARPIVRTGDHVSMGQMIGAAQEPGTAAVHSSVSGTVTAISRFGASANRDAFAVTIENNGEDEFASPIPFDTTWENTDAEALLDKLSKSGIVDFSGIAAPVHEKLGGARNSGISILALNTLVTEPWVLSDFQLLIEQTEKALIGALICKKITGVGRLIVLVNDKKPAIEQVLTPLLSSDPYRDIELIRLRPKYPQHHETLIRGVLGQNCLTVNVTTAVQMRDALVDCVPWYQRVVTVAGEPGLKPKNLLCRIGTPVEEALKAIETNRSLTGKIISGGPLSGRAVSTSKDPIIKSTSAIVAFGALHARAKGYACINCGRCTDVCPAKLAPMRLVQLSQKNDLAELNVWGIGDCIECALCAYVCPSGIDLLHHLHYGKAMAGLSVLYRKTAL